MTDDKIMEKVRKLLSKAERAGTEAEAEAFTAKATELMLKYSIDEAVLQRSGEHRDEKIVAVKITVEGYAKAKLELLRQVAKGLGCDAAFYANDRRGWSHGAAEVVGWESDIDAVRVLFASLQMQATSEAKRELARLRRDWPQLREARDEWRDAFVNAEYDRGAGWGHYANPDLTYAERQARRKAWLAAHPEPEDPGREMPHGRSFNQSFLIGYAREVGSRLSKQRKATITEVDDERPGTALAVIDRDKAVDTFAHARWNYGGKATGASSSSNAGYYSGKAAGSRANIGGATISGGRRALGR